MADLSEEEQSNDGERWVQPESPVLTTSAVPLVFNQGHFPSVVAYVPSGGSNISFGIWEFSMIDSKTLQHLNLPATCFVISSRSQLSSASKSSCIYGVPSQGVGLDLSHELYFHSYHMRQIRFDCFNVGNVLI